MQADTTGQFLYASNRGHDSLAVFRIDARTGLLEPAGHQPALGKWPRHFAMAPGGQWLLVANQDSDAIVVFRRDLVSGHLAPTGQTAAVSMPVCLRFVPVA